VTMPWGSTEEPTTTMTGRESIPVHVVSTDAKPGKTIAPEFARWRTFLISNTVGPNSITPGAQRILNRSLRRHEARIIVNGSGTLGSPSYDGEGEAPLPVAAGQTVASLNGGNPIPPGEYTLSGSTMLSGTGTVADINNMALYVGATQVTILSNGDGNEQLFPLPNITFTVPAGGAVVSIKILAAGSGTANYWASFVGTPANQPNTDGVIIGGREEISSGQPATPGNLAGYLQIGDNVTYKGQQELWVCYPSTNLAPVYVTVLDMQYASDPDAWREDE
jgi:hypothetical protein